MNLITETWRGLIRRRLWPVALALVAALVAVPVVLSKEPEVVPPPANLQAAAAEAGMPVTYVTSAAEEEAAAEQTGKRRRTLGVQKDPFEPAELPKVKKKKAKQAKQAKATSSSSKPEASSEGSGTSSFPAPSSEGGAPAPVPSAPEPTATPVATPKPAPVNSIRVRFTRVSETGDAETVEPKTVERFEVLPDEKAPLLVYRGLKRGGKVAVFELTGNVTVEGDGACEPTPEDCQYLELRAGETHFITVADTGEETDAQYQLDLVKINARK